MKRKRRNEWVDALVSMAVIILAFVILFMVRDIYFFAIIGVTLALPMILVALIIKYGFTGLLAMPQALWMAIQDRREKHGKRDISTSDSCSSSSHGHSRRRAV